jgi:hypothetical protein
MRLSRERQCLCCQDIFIPDYRNAKKQTYCRKPACRKESKAASQRFWSQKNPDYFKGAVHVERVREWRRANPDHPRRKIPAPVLQDDCPQIPLIKQEVVGRLPPAKPVQGPVLQDLCLTQHPVIVGLISHLTGCVLQEDIDLVTRRLEQLGQDVIASTSNPGGLYDSQGSHLSRPDSHRSRTVQLGGSASGP